MKASLQCLGAFILGMSFYHFFIEAKPTPVSAAKTEDHRKASVPRPPPEAKMALVTSDMKSNALVPFESLPAPPATQKPSKSITISLSEYAVGQMEADWNDLPQQAEAHREDLGWRMTRVSTDSSFFRAGLRQGDLVTTEFLDRLRNSNTELVRRMEQIFNRIAQ